MRRAALPYGFAWRLLLLLVGSGSGFALQSCDLQITPSAVGVNRVDVVTFALNSACSAIATNNGTIGTFSVAFGSLQVPLTNPLRSRQGTLELDVTPPLLQAAAIVDLRILLDGVSILYLPRSFTYYGMFAVDIATIHNNDVHVTGRNLPTAMKPSASLRLTLKGSISPLIYPLVVQAYNESQVSRRAALACAGWPTVS
jgi:hypothetical protein